MRKRSPDTPVVAAVSGGPDSVFLLHELLRGGNRRVVVAHVNHGYRGIASDKDQELVEELSKRYRLETRIRKEYPGRVRRGLEDKARRVRREFLKGIARECGGIVATGHTADDQVETILMRFFEGAGIAGLKGIPRDTPDGFVRPILDLWRKDIVGRLEKNRMAYRVDRTNLDCRFERNWIRNVLVPLLVGRYGEPVRKRIFLLGERFRELDEYLGSEARRWIRRNVKEAEGAATLPRKRYAGLPSPLRVRILQEICFGVLGTSPNERLLDAMDRSICAGKPSNRVRAGGGWEIANRYDDARFERQAGNESRPLGEIRVEEAGAVTPARARRIAAGGSAEVFDAEGLRLPLAVRPVRQGDRILPFGRSREKKLKEILIDRKVPRGERWGRPAVCDADGNILWVPGVLRSGFAPVTRKTRCAKIVSYFAQAEETTRLEPVL